MSIAVRLLVVVFLMTCAQNAIAVQPGEMLKDPAQEARARAISAGLRCLVCQNQSIDDSEADLAHDLRVLVRERIKAGDSDAQARQFIVARYGEYVLLKPPLNNETLFLWLGPAGLLLAASFAAFLFYRGRERTEPLSKEEQKRLDTLMKNHPPAGDA